MKRTTYLLWIKLALIPLLMLGISSQVLAKPETKVLGDFHMTLYQGAYGEVSDFELFTKQADNEIYLGISCSDRTPFPLLQVLLFNQHVLLDSSAELGVNYDFPVASNKPAELSVNRIALKGVLRSIKTADETSNKIRLELDTKQFKSMNAMAEGYALLLNQLKAASKVTFTFKDARFGDKSYHFSLKGLKALLEPHESVCR